MFDTVASPRSFPGIRTWMLPSPVVTSSTGVATALRLLREHNLPALPVVERGQLLGMVYEKDLLRLAPSEATTLDVYEQHAVLDRLTVRRAMRPAESLCANASLKDALTLVNRAAVEAVPVVDDQRVLGLLTWPALMKAVGAVFVEA